MRKFVALFLALVCTLGMVGCNNAKYNVEIADNYPIAHRLKRTYAAGEKVTVKLETITEHYYVLYVNGVEQEMDRDASDLTYTYFTFTMPSEDVLIQIEDKWVEIPQAPQNPSGKPIHIAMTIAETLPSCVAFEYREPNTPYCFYAYDADENLYRVLWTDWEGLNEKDQIIVEYEKLEELTYDVYPDGGWTPQYEITAISVKPTEIASCISNEQGAYVLTLPKSGKKITLRDEQRLFVPYITDALVVAAENKITDVIAKYNNSSGFYLQVSEDYLCLVEEVIHYMDPPARADGEDALAGCGIDHEHLFFSERITLCPVNTQTSKTPDESFGKGAARYLSGYLDDVNFIAGLSQSDFISQVERYRYNGTIVTDIVAGVNHDGPTGGGWQATGELFGFYNDYTEDNKHADYSNRLYTKVQLDGLDLPYGIQFSDTLEDAFQKIGLGVNPYSDFTPDKYPDTDMTLYSDDTSNFVFQDLNRTKEPVDYELPYVLRYSETYDIQRDGGETTTVERMIKLSFDCINHGALGQFEIRVNEISVLE